MIFYKVVVLKCDMYETAIQDERHFQSKFQANEFVNKIHHKHPNLTAVVILMA